MKAPTPAHRKVPPLPVGTAVLVNGNAASIVGVRTKKKYARRYLVYRFGWQGWLRRDQFVLGGGAA